MKNPTYFEELENFAKDLKNYNKDYKSLPNKTASDIIKENNVECINHFSPQAQKILNELKKGNSVFLTGAAGTGKSYLTKEIISAYSSSKVAVLGSTGIAAINIEGQTLHSFFKFGICDTLEELKANDRTTIKAYYGNNTNIFINKIKNSLKNLELIIIDEVSMLNKNLIDMIYYRFDQVGCYPSILFVGDFFQLPPVKDYGFAFESSNFKSAKPMILTKIKRQEDEEFQNLLNAVRVGKKEQWVIDKLESLNKEINEFKGSNLVSTNKEAMAINYNNLYKLKTKIYKSVAKVEKAKTQKDLARFWNESQAQEVVRFAIGAVVMFIMNNPKSNYMNGDMGIITKIEGKEIFIEKFRDGEIIKITKKELFAKYEFVYNKQKDELEKVVVVAVKQLPFKLAFAITTHKSQGLTLDRVKVNAKRIFTDAQLYVGLSRATKEDGLILKDFQPDMIRANDKVKDYYEKTAFDVLD